ncbi:MAG: ABC transporter permease, partial [Arachidicoccus sp.]|nr:ABC transporter permease [Arachidicoccus sp.]
KKWNSMVPSQPFNYTFMDADFRNIYHAEQQTGRLFIVFAALAIFIACLGLYGLVTFAAEQRTKEIGVRKVLGASVGSIASLLSKDFAKLIVIAMLIAFPIAWWAMHRWLQTFAYKTSLSWWIFLSAGIIAIIIAFVTISRQAIKAARANPVKSLKTE